MNRQFKPIPATLVAAVLLVLPNATPPAEAQAIAETGSIYAMPKTVPDAGNLIATLGKTYNAGIDPHISGSSPGTDKKIPGYDYDDPQEQYRMVGAGSIKLWNQARACEKQGRSDEAERLYRKTLAVRWQVWRDRDPAVPQLLTVIGSLDEKRGKLQSAETCYHDLLTLTAKKHGPGSWELCQPLTLLAQVQSKQHKHQEAAANYRLVHQLTERKYGETDPRTASAAANLAQSLASAAEGKEAHN